MALSARKFIFSTAVKSTLRSNRLCLNNLNTPFMRGVVYERSGAILDKPEVVRFGVVKALCVVIPFLYIGGMFAKKTAAFLEDYELFVPEDDDD